ncbi:MAG TPA: luciferase family protein [Bryobacteraceae bacterium]|jgi:hypothetical protein
MNTDRSTPLERPDQEISPLETVRRQVSSWKGISLHQHRFGGVEFRLGRRELGHLHAKFADLPFPRAIRDEMVASGRAKPHHVLPDSGWVTVLMRTASEAENVIGLFRLNYERAANAE